MTGFNSRSCSTIFARAKMKWASPSDRDRIGRSKAELREELERALANTGARKAEAGGEPEAAE